MSETESKQPLPFTHAVTAWMRWSSALNDAADPANRLAASFPSRQGREPEDVIDIEFSHLLAADCTCEADAYAMLNAASRYFGTLEVKASRSGGTSLTAERLSPHIRLVEKALRFLSRRCDELHGSDWSSRMHSAIDYNEP